MKKMLKLKNMILLILIAVGYNAQAQSVLGKWNTINEDTGKPNSLIEIYEENGEVKGKVIKILKEENRGQICSKCSGDMKNRPIEGLELMTGFEKNGREYSGGIITDPKSGKQYKAKLWVDEDNPDLLKVRGYIAFFYKTQTWHRAE
jgi:uncharacterized protein (DUF2147 family)